MPPDPLEEFYGRGEAAIRPGDIHGPGYDAPLPVPADFLLPSDPAADIDNPAWARRFTTAFRFKTGRALSRIASMILPSVPLGTFNPEDFYPDDLLAWGGALAVQIAAQVSAVAVCNPAASGLLCTIEEWQAQRLQTAGLVALFQGANPPPLGTGGWGSAATAMFFRDTRFGAGGLLSVTKLFVNQSTNAPNPPIPGNGNGIFVSGSGAGVSPCVGRNWVLAPGASLCWSPMTPGGAQLVNEGINLFLVARLKVIDPAGQKTPITN